MCQGQQRVYTAFMGIDAIVAETPFAFIAVLARPEAGVGEGVAAVAKVTFLQALGGIRGGASHRDTGRLNRPRGCFEVLAANEDMWWVHGLTYLTCMLRSKKVGVRLLAETEPVITATAGSIASQTQVHLAYWTVLVKIILYLLPRAASTIY